MKITSLSPYFGTPLPIETSTERAARLYSVAEAYFGPIDAGSTQAVPRILALCQSVVPGVQPDIPLRHALSILYRLHESKSFNVPEARATMPFVNAAFDLQLGNLNSRIEEIMLQCPECTSHTWPMNVCNGIELIWEAEGFNLPIDVIDYGNGYRIDATGIAVDLAREQQVPDASTNGVSDSAKAVDQLTNALIMLVNNDSTDFTGAVSCQFRAWCSVTIGRKLPAQQLETPAYAHLVSRVASKVPLLLIHG